MMDGRQEMRNIDIHEWKEEGGRTWKREEEGEEEEGGVGEDDGAATATLWSGGPSESAKLQADKRR